MGKNVSCKRLHVEYNFKFKHEKNQTLFRDTYFSENYDISMRFINIQSRIVVTSGDAYQGKDILVILQYLS